ncbi:MAG: VOC family protein [Pelagimonas sp.]|uniref:VOC family protein n=1 Tax=Pelagimonas sp. TaxID=2073170 RepID=UPI003D6BD147
MLTLDHIAVLGETLEEAAAHLEAALHSPMLPGGKHDRFGTHNRLLGMAPGLYLEAIAIDPSAEKPKDARWFGLDEFSGAARLDKWICRVDDIDAALAQLPMAGRRVDLSRGELRWSMAVPEDGKLPFDGFFPALIQWHSDLIPGRILPAGGLELEQLTISHPQADALQSVLGPLLTTPQVTFATGNAGMSAKVSTPLGSMTLT